MFALAGNLYVRDVEGLGVNVAVYAKREQLAELFGVDIFRCQRFLRKICPGAGIVVLRGRDLSDSGLRNEKTTGEEKRHRRFYRHGSTNSSEENKPVDT